MSERIMTLHPAGKTGVNIDRQKYDVVREAILEAVRTNGTITFSDLTAEVRSRLRSHICRIDLLVCDHGKARLGGAWRDCARVPKSKPQQLVIP